MPITLENLEAVNRASIGRAGPRYTPGLDPNAPNLKIGGLIQAIDALGYSPEYRQRLNEFAGRLRAAWKKAFPELKGLLESKVADTELGAALLEELSARQPGGAAATLKKIQLLLEVVISRTEEYETRLYQSQRQHEDNLDERNAVASRLHHLREFTEPIYDLRAFVESPDFSLIKINRLFLKGSWGSGKTHLLCDITRTRMQQGLPTLLLLGQTLGSNTDPLLAICQVSRLAKSPAELLQGLSAMGKASGGRALLVVDAINEGDRIAWHRHMDAVVNRVKRYRNVGLILSCRSPFEVQVMPSRSRSAFVETTHTGFEDIEFDAQREFFGFYKIPSPHIPLLAPEFSRPLFLKILCETVASLSQGAKRTRINDFAAGHTLSIWLRP